MRISIMIAMLALAGCGASESDIDKKVAKEVERRLAEAKRETKAEPEAEKRSAAEIARDRSALRADIREARELVLDRMRDVNRESEGEDARHFLFEVDITNLDGVSWDWTERELSARLSASGAETGRAEQIVYAVDPRALSGVRLATYRGLPAVRFDCTAGKCITAKGKRKTATEDGGQTRAIDERRAYNVWAIPDKSDARRIVDALDRIVAAAKAM